MKDEYKFEKKQNLSTPSESEEESSYDEIKPEKHTLCDLFVCSSAKSYLSGRQIFDFVSKEIFFKMLNLERDTLN